jgi:hypothetical protein
MSDQNRQRKDKTTIERMQPDPVLREGRRGSGWVWIVSLAILIAIIVTFYAVDANHKTAQDQAPSASPPTTTGSATSPQPAQPTGRGNANVPPSGKQSTAP